MHARCVFLLVHIMGLLTVSSSSTTTLRQLVAFCRRCYAATYTTILVYSYLHSVPQIYFEDFKSCYMYQVGTRLVACLTAIYVLLFIQEMAHPTKCPYFRAAPRELFHLRLGSARAFSPLRFRICFTMKSFWLEKSDFFIVVVC